MTDEDILHARLNYRPSGATPSARKAFAQWTERIVGLPDGVAARELAGLTDEQLQAMALDFEKAPRRKRTDVFRFSFAIAALLAMIGAGFAIAEVTVPAQAVGRPHYLAGAGAFLGAAFIALCAGVLSGFRLVPTEAAYARLGLFVGLLNEQHPWLYNTYFVLRNPAAIAYRDRVLRERGPVRGFDFVLMRQIAELHEKMELTHNARAVAAAVQGASEVLAPAGTHAAPAIVPLAPSAAATPAPSLAAVPGKVLSLGSSSEAA